jgi:hypothetical protein
MLNLRSGLVLTAAALCLWALYSLLNSLKEPGLLRSEKAAVLKGCDALDDLEIRKQCMPLICQKALLDSKVVPWNARFTVEEHRASAADVRFELVSGAVSTGAESREQQFGCLIRDNRVLLSDVFDVEALQAFVDDVDDDPEHMSGT